MMGERPNNKRWTSMKAATVFILYVLPIRNAFVPPLRQRPRLTALSLQEAAAAGETRPQNVTARLWTYAYNIPRQSDNRRRPVHSLVNFLQEQQQQRRQEFSDEALERATIQAVRAASTSGDYRLIIRVVQAAIDFAATSSSCCRLPPRLFGEAIESLSRTSCNASKLKQVWRLAQTHDIPLGAFELNTMLRALASRGKIRAALNLYHETDIIGDAYTMSTLMSALTDSIQSNQVPCGDNDCGSPCWQYNDGRQLLETCPQSQLNNRVFAAALGLSERAGHVFDEPRHHVAKAAMDLLQLMKKRDISPDVVTCSLVASAFDKAHQYKAAIALLDAMQKQAGTESWSLPEPNEYLFSSVISACARCNECNMALQVLDRMRTSSTVQPNTWVYNAALAACKRRNGRMALTLLDQMQRDYEKGMDTAPDSVSYNTALAAIDGRWMNGQDELEEWGGSVDKVAYNLVQQMKERRLPRDALTYHNAIRASRVNGETVLKILDGAVEDLLQNGEVNSKLSGRAADGVTFVTNSALSVISSAGDLDRVSQVLSKMVERGTMADSETVIHLLTALGASGNTDHIPTMLLGLNGDFDSLLEVESKLGIDFHKMLHTDLELEQRHYATGIKSCLMVNDIDTALEVLSMMKKQGFSPDSDTLTHIALAYCRLATIASAEESKISRRLRQSKRKKRTLGMDVKRRVSAARARSALDIARSIEDPSVQFFTTVSTACCSAGMWDEGRILLGRVHDAAAERHADDSRGNNLAFSLLPGLHRSLLKLCASKGNATAAVGFVDDIQAFSNRIYASNRTTEDDASLSTLFLDALDESDTDVPIPTVPSPRANRHKEVGMTDEDWKLLLIAASKSGHWRLCLGALQFMRPFLESTHPDLAATEPWPSKRYDKLARALTAAVLCFEMRGQYAWAIRAIEDWIEWSGRRPRKEAILGTFRILASRGQGYEVNRLLTRVLKVPSVDEETEVGSSYEEALCVGAVNALHANGLYDDADVLYIQASSHGYLPFAVERSELSDQFILDLHGMNVAMAHSAVRIALQQYVLPESPQEADMIIVTGRGMKSAQRLRPILRPEVQRMLLEEFYPPLSTTSIPGNMGALRIPANDVKEWVLQQRQQKGARMLAIADVLKDLTSGERLRRSIELSLQYDENETTDRN